MDPIEREEIRASVEAELIRASRLVARACEAILAAGEVVDRNRRLRQSAEARVAEVAFVRRLKREIAMIHEGGDRLIRDSPTPRPAVVEAILGLEAINTRLDVHLRRLRTA